MIENYTLTQASRKHTLARSGEIRFRIQYLISLS